MNVTEFPVKEIKMKNDFIKVLKNNGADDDLISFAAERFDYHMDEAKNFPVESFSIALPKSISEGDARLIGDAIQNGVYKLAKMARGIISSLRTELLMKEIKIYQYERDAGGDI